MYRFEFTRQLGLYSYHRSMASILVKTWLIDTSRPKLDFDALRWACRSIFNSHDDSPGTTTGSITCSQRCFSLGAKRRISKRRLKHRSKQSRYNRAELIRAFYSCSLSALLEYKRSNCFLRRPAKQDSSPANSTLSRRCENELVQLCLYR